MPPKVALLLCVIFVLFLLRVERRISRGVSAALWIPTLWMVTISTKPLALWLGVTGGNNEQGSIVDEAVLIALTIAGIIVLVHRRFNCVSALRRHTSLLILLGYMFVSTFWSAITFIALRRCARQTIILVMALVIMSEANPQRAFESVLRRLVYVFIPLSLVVVKYYPYIGVSYNWTGTTMWQGVAIEKNAFGFLCSMTILFLLSARYRQWREHTKPGGRLLPWIDMFIVLTAAFLLSGAQKNSATAGGSLAAGAATFIGMIFLRKVKLGLPQVILLALVLSLIVFGMSAPLLGGGGVVGFSSQFGRDATLTGRTEIWAGLLPEVEQRPLLGFGFGSFWTSHRRIVHDISDGHNGYLDVLLDLGAVGLSIYSAWFMLAARKLHKALSLDYDRATLAVSFLVMTLAFNITESTLSALVQPMTAVAILVSMLVPYEAARVRLPDELSDVGDPATMSQLARSALPGVFFERYEDIVATLGERTRSECARLHWYCGTVDRPLIS